MKTSKNRLLLDYKDMPDLKAALGGLSAGDKCKVTFELEVVANNDEQLESDIEGVEYDIEGEEEDGEGEVETSSDEPVMAVVMKRSDSAKKKKKKDDDDEMTVKSKDDE